MVQRRKPLRPIAELSSRQRNERRLARAAGFRDEYTFRRWVNKWSAVDPRDPRYYDKSARLKQADKLIEIARSKRMIKRYETPAKEILRKYKGLVLNNGWSHLTFWLQYRLQIDEIINNNTAASTEGRSMRRLRRELRYEMMAEGDFDDFT